MKKKNFLILAVVVAFVSFAFMGARSVEPASPILQNPHKTDLGVGPVKKVELGPIDSKMVAEGKKLFNNKCSVCHELKQKKVGPPLQNITKERTPEFIMNLLLNTQQMQQDDPAVKQLMKDYNNLPMPDPSVDREQARSILEYLRSVAE